MTDQQTQVEALTAKILQDHDRVEKLIDFESDVLTKIYMKYKEHKHRQHNVCDHIGAEIDLANAFVHTLEYAAYCEAEKEVYGK